MMSRTPIREQLWSPVQNTSLWLGWWLHGLLPTDQVIDAFQDVQGPAHTLVVAGHLVDHEGVCRSQNILESVDDLVGGEQT
ncbi:MAG: hypothetical protein ACTHV5_08055, partial [Candidatus Corynebacterium faecigallinarum]